MDESPKRVRQQIPTSNLRRQLFTAPIAQGYLLFRVMVYCLICSIATSASCWIASRLESPAWVNWFIAPLLVMLCVIPYVLYDVAKASHRVVGPFARVQRAIRQLANGDQVRTLTLREDDHWNEWLQEFNIMITRVQSRMTAKSCGQEGEK